jgi:cellulose synthase operon protein C
VRKTKATGAFLGVLSVTGIAIACGPFFPTQLFNDRQQTLRAVPVNAFDWEAQRLVTPKNRYKPGIPSDAFKPTDRDAAEELSQRQLARVTAMRQAPDGSTALQQAGDLAPAIALYTAGAVDFSHGNFPEAEASFRQILALPVGQSAPRAVWAQFMLGRIAAQAGRNAEAADDFDQTRRWVREGAPDPLGLANASLGEQAKLRLTANDIPGAVGLYAEQAADGSDDGVNSLRIVARHALAKPETLPELVKDPVTRRLLTVYVLSRTDDYDGTGPTQEQVQPLAKAVAAQPLPGPGTDRLAALEYASGNNDVAETLAEKANGPLALWIRAKIAVQRGDTKSAAALYAKALSLDAAPAQHTGPKRGADSDVDTTGAPPATARPLDDSNTTLLRGETATIYLTRGDFQTALLTLWPVASTYWADVAYLAERVLTTAELKTFVDTYAADAALPLPSSDWFGDTVDPRASIRNLLARRLVREGRVRDALKYVGPPTKDQPDLRPILRDYLAAQRHEEMAYWSTARARALWQQALLLRQHGMEMTGTEIAPDEFALSGIFENGFGPEPGPDQWPKTLYVPAEQARYAKSAPLPNLRFHYRYRAADAAIAAAQNLPTHSQAYAATLCQAASWMFQSRADDRAHAIYETYLHHGAVVPFAAHFGRNCPAPDFAAAPAARRKYIEMRVRDVISRAKVPAGLATAFGIAAVGAFVARRSRKS